MDKKILGSELSKELRTVMKEKVAAYKAAGERGPCLAVILVGDNPASLSYVKGKEKACQSVGMDNRFYHLPENTAQEELEAVIRQCNEDETVDGILVQLPLPKGLDEDHAIMTIDPSKDVDGLHPVNIGLLHAGKEGFVPCTPKGVMELLKKMDCQIDGKRAVVLGRSKLVGEPVAKLLQNANATVTVCHSHTKDIREVTKEADILIAAIGKPKFVDHTFIKEGAYVIDVGINRMDDGKLCGDVNTDDVMDMVSAITPVPKGVGPMTICMLVENTLIAYEKRKK